MCLCAFSFLHARVVWSLFFMCVFIVFVFVLALCGFFVGCLIFVIVIDVVDVLKYFSMLFIRVLGH